jgi:pSer/pThr/pTyr-binding forkhead associated (FHA) protein
MVLQIVVVHIGHRLRVPLKPEILMGRQDSNSNVFPEVNLTPYGAVEKGVSRQHARIVFHDDELTIEDIGSVNGTFLNGRRIVPYQAMPLNDGDVVQLGKLVLQVYFDLLDSAQESLPE